MNRRWKMKTILAIVMVLGMTAVYEPGSIVPKYFIENRPRGEYHVYDSKQLVVPKYIVKPDRWGNGYRVYETGKPVLPVYRIERKDALQ
jgi:hypothetical protein